MAEPPYVDPPLQIDAFVEKEAKERPLSPDMSPEAFIRRAVGEGFALRATPSRAPRLTSSAV